MAIDHAESRPDGDDAEWPLAALSWPMIDPGRIVIRYDDVTDTLLVHLHGRSLPAVSAPLDVIDPHGVGYLYLDLALDTPAVVGIFVEGFLTRAVPLHPPWQALVPMADSAHDAGAVNRFVEDVQELWRQSLRGLVTQRTP